MRLYLSDSESRQVLTAGGVLIVRPALPDTRSEFQLWRPGDVVAGREAWTPSWGVSGIADEVGILYRADMLIVPVSIDRYLSLPRGHSILAAHKEQYPHWRSPAVMPDWAVRHRLRAVRVECRQVGGISVKEALETGAPSLGLQINNGKEPIRRVRYDWEQRFGKRAPWDEGWAWFTWFERAVQP